MNKIIFLAVLMMMFSSVATAGTLCKTIHKVDGRVYTINAALHKAAHIILPEPVLGAPINGNVDLWQAEAQNNHLFIKPTTNQSDGAETTITVIGLSNTSYDFRVVRGKVNDYCVEIKNDGALIQGNALGQWQPPKSGASMEADLLRFQIREMQKELAMAEELKTGQIEDALLQYRSHIYTRYRWTHGSGFMGENVVSDVWDDGRWSYIRVRTDNKGLLTVSGLIDGKKELIEYQYDREGKIYKIVGIYPKLYLRYGNAEVVVTRGDIDTAGAF